MATHGMHDTTHDTHDTGPAADGSAADGSAGFHAGRGGAWEAERMAEGGDGVPWDRLTRLVAPPTPSGPPCTSGFRGLDRLLPAGGICRGSLVEWIAGPASGAAALVLAVACRLVAARRAEATGRSPGAARRGGPGAKGGTIVVVDRRGRFHPPAVLPWVEAAQGGAPSAPRTAHDAPPGSLVVVRPAHDEDEIWAIDQALRCPGVTAVVAWPERATTTALRRWQLGARGGGAVGLLLRPPRARRDPSWAQARLDVTALPSVDARALAPLAAGAADARSGGDGAGLPGVRLVPSLGVRRLRVTLVQGPWACDAPPDARWVEIDLDLATGREAFAAGREAFAGQREAAAGGVAAAAMAAEGGRATRGDGRGAWPDGRTLPGGMSCRAS
jgi:hypothetical protein